MVEEVEGVEEMENQVTIKMREEVEEIMGVVEVEEIMEVVEVEEIMEVVEVEAIKDMKMRDKMTDIEMMSKLVMKWINQSKEAMVEEAEGDITTIMSH